MEEPVSKKAKTAGVLSLTQPWVEKYRPGTLDDLVAHKEIIGVIKKLIKADRLPHMLLYGPPGTGKTSTIVAAAKDMYGKTYQAMTLELNASDDRGIDVSMFRFVSSSLVHSFPVSFFRSVLCFL